MSTRTDAGAAYVAAVEALHAAFVELAAQDAAAGPGTRSFGASFPDPVDLRHGEFLADLKGNWKDEARVRRGALPAGG